MRSKSHGKNRERGKSKQNLTSYWDFWLEQNILIKCDAQKCWDIDWLIAFRLLCLKLRTEMVLADHLHLRKSGKEFRHIVNERVSSLSDFITKSTYLHIWFQINQQREERGWTYEHLLARGLNILQSFKIFGYNFVQILWVILLYILSFTVSPVSTHPIVISSLFAVYQIKEYAFISASCIMSDS